MARVFVAMSGGVDSSVAASLLLEQGHDVTGVTMQLRPADGEHDEGCATDAIGDARRVCDLLGIPHHTLDLRDDFEAEIVAPYADEYAAGRTPNPCIRCNARLKFGRLLDLVLTMGAEYLATGHYARVVDDPVLGRRLARAAVPSKDQSYFLYRLTDAQIERALFPVGELDKDAVRAMAARLGMAVHDKPDSQDVCFAEQGHVPVVATRRPDGLATGAIVDRAGRELGRHDGIARYTIGQRHGLGIGGPSGPLFVVAIDSLANTIVVGPRESLEVNRIEAGDVVWLGRPAGGAVSAASSLGEEQGFDVLVQTRYRMEPHLARVRVRGDELDVDLSTPVRGVAPGQAVVCYAGDVVLGGGTIERAG